jgi:dTDP-4-dehydrorhamnose 3,5-epimerase
MKVQATTISEVLVFEPKVFSDNRGFFYESFNDYQFNKLTGFDINFVQENHSKSHKSVLRGLHYQIHKPQGKLVRVISGEIFDVAVDLRKSSSTFGHWVGVTLSAENKRQLWVPEGFGHGFVVTSTSTAECLYKVTDYWISEFERVILWSEQTIGVDWPIKYPILSARDQNGESLNNAEVFL